MSCYSSGPTRVRRAFFSDWRCFASRIFSLARRERRLFCRRIFSTRVRSAATSPVRSRSIRSRRSRRARNRLSVWDRLLLAFYGKAGRHMDEVDAGRGLVDLLSAGSGGADEGFAEFLLPDAEALHPLAERRLFFLRNDHFFRACTDVVPGGDTALQRE